ncbi:MAG: phosphatase PAP2 family protein [Bacteroidota bacterium]
MQLGTKTIIISFSLLLALTLNAQQQAPYYFSLERELIYGGAAVGSTLVGLTMHQSVNDVSISTIELPKVSAFDDVAPKVLNIKPSNLSDGFLFASIALPSTFLLEKNTRKDIVGIGLLYTEAMLLNLGITDIIKIAVLRPRPYTLNPDLAPSTILKRNDRASFFSGHTSVTATAGFFCARVFADYYPDSSLKPYVWTVAALIPATTGYLRIRAGKHYPTDVLTGYIIGGAIGYLIPTLHKKPIQNRKLDVSMGLGGILLRYHL